jgi:hypothetical protein
MDRLPGLSTKLPAERDYWGRKSTLHRAYSPHKPNRIDIEFGRLAYGPEPHPNGYGFEFNPDERDFFKQRAGQLSKQFMEEFMDGKRSAGKVEDFRRHQAMSMRSSGEFKQKIDKELRQAFAELAHDAQEEAHEDVKERFPGYIKAMEDQEDFEMKQTEIYMKRLGID